MHNNMKYTSNNVLWYIKQRVNIIKGDSIKKKPINLDRKSDVDELKC